MSILIIGLVMFFAAHSIRIVADDWRARTIARVGEKPWKGIHSLVSILGLVLVVWGYGLTRADPIVLWHPPLWTRHIAALLMIPSLILLAAAYIPENRLKTKLGHPMLAGIKLWAFAHLLSNGTLSDVVLFGSFLLWAAFDFRAARARDRRAGVSYAEGRASRDIAVLTVGLLAWIVFARHLHAWLIGVQPLA